MTTRLLTLFVVVICFFVLLRTYWMWYVYQARQKGVYPPVGKATLFDVRRLLIQGEKALAVRLYGEIFRASRRAAAKAVEDLEKSIQAKKSQS